MDSSATQPLSSLQATAAKFAVAHLSASEPCSIIGMSGSLGKVALSQAIASQLDRPFCCSPCSAAELETILQSLEKSPPKIAIVCIDTNEDCSWAIERLDALRTRYHQDFSPLVISHIGGVYKALQNHQKILVRALFPMPLLDAEGTRQLIAGFAAKFGFEPTLAQAKQIFEYSGGHIGLVKSLYLHLKSHSDAKLSLKQIFTEEAVLYRLQTLAQDLPLEKISLLLSGKYPPLDQAFFAKYGYLNSKNAIFTPLLREFVEMSEMLPASQFQYALTAKELLVFQEARKSLNNYISRDALAFILWKDKWEEMYSDWAIDQIVHRIKSKLKDNSSPFQLETKKGVGIRLVRN